MPGKIQYFQRGGGGGGGGGVCLQNIVYYYFYFSPKFFKGSMLDVSKYVSFVILT